MFRDFIKYLQILSKYTSGEGHNILTGIILGTICQIGTLATPFFTRFLIDTIIGQKNYHMFLWFLLVCLAIIIVLFAASLSSNYFLIRSFRKSGLKLRMQVFKNLQHAPLEFFEETSSGEISYRLLQDAAVVESSWISVLITLPLQFILLISGIFMALWYFKLALFVFLILGLQVFVIIKFHKPLHYYYQRVKVKEQEVMGFTVEHFQKIQLIRSLSTEKKEQIRFHKKFHELVKVAIRGFMLTKFSSATVIAVNNLWVFGILWYGGTQVIEGKMTLGTLAAFLLFTNILYQPISTLTNFILSFQDIRASLNRLLEYLNVKPKCLESPKAVEYTPKEGRITLKNVLFSYNSRPVLNNINLEIPPNSIFALVGRSGAGKTTLCRLLVRFYDPNQGVILLDNKDIKDITNRSLRRSVLLMLQSDYVFTSTIWDNITYGSERVTKEEVYRAAQAAGLDFIDILPAGYETKIGEGGIKLSAGEAQRIALARVFLLAPKVLILDEPTAFIDCETEEKIKNSLMRLKKRCTIILIAHRLSTVEIADKIGVIDGGRIVEVGTHSELIKKDSAYRKIYATILSK